MPPDAKLTLKLFVLSGQAPNALMAGSINSICNSHPGWRAEVLELDPRNIFEGDAAIEAEVYGITCFPTLIIEHGEEDCLRLEGYQSKPTIEEHLNRLS